MPTARPFPRASDLLRRARDEGLQVVLASSAGGEEVDIGAQLGQPVQDEASLQPATDRRLLVAREVDAGRLHPAKRNVRFAADGGGQRLPDQVARLQRHLLVLVDLDHLRSVRRLALPRTRARELRGRVRARRVQPIATQHPRRPCGGPAAERTRRLPWCPARRRCPQLRRPFGPRARRDAARHARRDAAPPRRVHQPRPSHTSGDRRLAGTGRRD